MPGRGIRGLALTLAAIAAMVFPGLNTAFASPPAQNDTSGSSDSGVVGNSYTSPSFGYSISWSHDWTVADEKNDPAYNRLQLSSDVSTVYFEGFSSTSSLDECVTTLSGVFSAEDGVSD